MEPGTTLEEKLSRAAVFVCKRGDHSPETYFDEDEVGLLLTKDAGVLLRECVHFLAPYL